VRVTNTGTTPGREVAQFYVGLPGSRVARPPRALAGFAVVELAPGPNKAVAFDLRAGNFKAASTEWKHAAAVKQLDKPKFVSLLLYTKQAGVFTLGNVRLPKAP